MTEKKNDEEFLSDLRFEPLTKSNWNKFTELFGGNGAGAGCWCMYFRQSKSDHENGKAECANQNRMKNLVWNNEPTGIIGFYKEIPIAWCALSPREDFIRLEKSRVHKPIDDLKVWSIPCTFVAKDFRKNGISIELLKGVIEYAKLKGIKILEAYPTIPTQEKLPDAFAWVGLYKTFEKAGFEIVDHRSKHRPMVRYYVK
ncbi:MAG: GNAT family N-acetyltransferase [Cyclobacteriaceae bacterium]